LGFSSISGGDTVYVSLYNDMQAVLGACMELLKMKVEIYGYHLSLLNIVSFGVVSGLCGWVVWEVLNRD